MSTLENRQAARDEDDLDRESVPRPSHRLRACQHARLIALMDACDGLSSEDRFLLLLALVRCYLKMPLPGTERS
jgi:hypothetical protein